MGEEAQDQEFDAMVDDEFEALESEDDTAEMISAIVEPARMLAARRAIEARMEEKRMQADLNYLELDFEDEE